MSLAKFLVFHQHNIALISRHESERRLISRFLHKLFLVQMYDWASNSSISGRTVAHDSCLAARAGENDERVAEQRTLVNANVLITLPCFCRVSLRLRAPRHAGQITHANFLSIFILHNFSAHHLCQPSRHLYIIIMHGLCWPG